MPEIRSALASVYETGSFSAAPVQPGVSIKESPVGDLVLVSSWPDSFDAVCRLLSQELETQMPETYRRCVVGAKCSVFMVAPRRLLICADDAGLGPKLAARFTTDQAVVSELGHSRTLIRLEGPETRALLSRGLPVDLDPSVFPRGAFAQSAIHHIWLLIHNVSPSDRHGAFDIYVPRAFAVSFWHWITSVAAVFGYQVLEADI
jgi:sarcosine oxidase subunit gamma